MLGQDARHIPVVENRSDTDWLDHFPRNARDVIKGHVHKEHRLNGLLSV